MRHSFFLHPSVWMLSILFALLPLSATAQQKLKWAHVYESSEPFHTESVWAAE